jgi:uroporphyrinogen-III decarboxylase
MIEKPSVESIEPLMAQVLEAVESARNKARREAPMPRITVYLENIGWTQLLDYDMNDYYGDPLLNCELQLRQKLIGFEMFDDDSPISADLSASTGMYFDFTVVGLEVTHEPNGVPHIQEDHPLRREADVSLLARHNFYVTGEMPRVFELYEKLQELTKGRMRVAFPRWERGPLDMAVQLRGYEQLMADARERPVFVHDLMRYLVEERIRWWDAYRAEFTVTDRTAGIGDDWINVPFISPRFFEEFCLPRYLELEEYHGRISYLHSCGNKAPLHHLIRRIESLGNYEVNHWTPLADTCRNLPPTKSLTIALLNADILVQSEAEQEAQLREIKELCAGRRYCVIGSALMKMHDDYQEDIARAQRWITLAKRVLHCVPPAAL